MNGVVKEPSEFLKFRIWELFHRLSMIDKVLLCFAGWIAIVWYLPSAPLGDTRCLEMEENCKNFVLSYLPWLKKMFVTPRELIQSCYLNEKLPLFFPGDSCHQIVFKYWVYTTSAKRWWQKGNIKFLPFSRDHSSHLTLVIKILPTFRIACCVYEYSLFGNHFQKGVGNYELVTVRSAQI